MEKINIKELQKSLIQLSINQTKILRALDNHNHNGDGIAYLPYMFTGSFNTVTLDEIKGIFEKAE